MEKLKEQLLFLDEGEIVSTYHANCLLAMCFILLGFPL